MVPLFDVVTVAIAVVLQRDDGNEITVCEFRIQRFDFFVECHYPALTSAPVIYVYVPPAKTTASVEDAWKAYISK